MRFIALHGMTRKNTAAKRYFDVRIKLAYATANYASLIIIFYALCPETPSAILCAYILPSSPHGAA
jgi:hypothetical protein